MWDALDKTRQEGFGPEVKRRIMLGAYALSSGYYDAYYLKAQKVRTLIRQELQRVFEDFDALATPTSPSVAFRFGERTEDPVQMYLSDVCTVPANIAGIPGISVPSRAVGRAAGGPSAPWPPPLGEDAAAHRTRLPAGDELAHDETAGAAGGVERKHTQEDSQWETKTVS